MTEEPVSLNSQSKSLAKPIALCLSGGGFRATFYHLGVLSLLRDVGLLSRVKHVAAVSGGSIIAAHLALFWEDYVDLERAPNFYKHVQDLIKLAQMDLRGRIVRRMLLGGWLFPGLQQSKQLIRHYAAFYKDKKLSDVSAEAKFYFLATSMTTGRLWSFSRHKISVYDPSVSIEERYYQGADINLSKAIAASSAFPPLFPPIEIDKEDLHAMEEEFPVTEFLTDGGVFDNVGVSIMRKMLNGADAFIIASDASAPFDWRTGKRRWHIVTRNVRAMDIMMNRVALLEKRGAVPNELRLYIGEVVENEDFSTLPDPFFRQPSSVQKMARFIRTDLDEFDYDVIRVLVRHGYEVALKNLRTMSTTLPLEKVTDPCPLGWPDPEKMKAGSFLVHAGALSAALSKGLGAWARFSGQSYEEQDVMRDITKKELAHTELEMERASRRRMGLWSASDWASWVLLALFGTMLMMVVRLFWRQVIL